MDREMSRRMYDGKEFYVKGEEGSNPNIRYALPMAHEALKYRFVEIVDGKVTRAFTTDEVEVRDMAISGTPQKEVPVTKRFHRSDTLVYEYSVIDMHDLRESARSNYSNVSRHCVKLQAAPGVTWQEIAEMVNELNRKVFDHTEDRNPPLMCCRTETVDFIVALTLKGYLKVCENMPSYGRIPYEELVENLAKEMVAIRDFEEWHNRENWKQGDTNYRPRKFSEFWPKD